MSNATRLCGSNPKASGVKLKSPGLTTLPPPAKPSSPSTDCAVKMHALYTTAPTTKQFQSFVVFVERQFNSKIKFLRKDGGKEYRKCDLFCEKLGIGRQVTQPNTSASSAHTQCTGLESHRGFWGTMRCLPSAQRPLVVGVSDETKENRVFLLNEGTVTVTRDAKRVSHSSDSKNESLREALTSEPETEEPRRDQAIDESPSM